MRKLFVVLFTLIFLVGITTAAYAASGQLNGAPQTLGATDYNPYPGYEFVPGYGDSMDNDLDYYNANNSGEGVSTNNGSTLGTVIKSDNMKDTAASAVYSVQRTHGEYKNNTNSCASCHQTHTAAAAGLLIKDSVFTTCSACHDGTLGFYNVFTPSSAGTFGGTKAGNASVHMADGTFEQKYAPGGNLTLTGSDNGGWTEMFDCASCHAPHGSYSDRLLHYNPNDMANTSIANKGQKLVNNTVVDVLPDPATATVDLVVYRTTAGTAGINAALETGTTPV
ncbi:MAG: cytochrome c3 family protein, partial [Eubacteriales bacterium]